MEHFKNPTEKFTGAVGAAYAEIQVILGRIHATGAVDTEPSAIKAITRQMLAGDITPEEALDRVRGIEESRQDYH